jgi:L-lactate dehydrogenase complex protein LldG
VNETSPTQRSMGAQSGDRVAFLARMRSGAATVPPENLAHPMPGGLDAVPLAVSSLLDVDDVVGSFLRNATINKSTVHRCSLAELPELVAEVASRHAVTRAVVSPQPLAQHAAETLLAIGVTVASPTIGTSAAADLGVTVASSALATTGTIVQRTDDVGSRTASLLPPVHLCIVPASVVVESTAEVLRALGGTDLPSNVVLVTGPSRSGDIEQTMAMGVHGPVTVELALIHDI